MPIRVQNDLPVKEILEQENIFVMDEMRAAHQDIRPISIGLLNLMPLKEDTELQILRALSNSPLQVDVTFVRVTSHVSKNTSTSHIYKFYEAFDDIKDKKFDGFIITGAPVEQMPFEDVDYWEELKRIMEWTKTNVVSTLHLCWGAQAGIYYHYGIDKVQLPEKRSGLFWHHVRNRKIPIVRGFDDKFLAPHSRHTEVPQDLLEKDDRITILADSDSLRRFLKFVISSLILSFSIRILTGLTIIRADNGHTSSSTTSPFSFNVEPVSTISTMTSDKPTIGASSIEPFNFTISTV